MLPTKRKQLIISGNSALVIKNTEMPEPASHEVLIKVTAAGVNRGDILQRRGLYKAPDNASAVPGLEVSGKIVKAGIDVTSVKVGDTVCALTEGNGYSDYALSHEDYCFQTGKLDLQQTAAFPEALFTIWHNIFQRCGLTREENILIHGGSNGIGVIAIQLCALLGARVFCTAGSEEKRALCQKLGAEKAFDYHLPSFFEELSHIPSLKHGKNGMDVILDIAGGDFIERNFIAAAEEARICLIALIRGHKTTVSFAPVMTKRLTITGSTLRPLSQLQKSAIAEDIRERVWPEILAGKIKPVIDSVFPFSEADLAHQRMESGLHSGKILLLPD